MAASVQLGNSKPYNTHQGPLADRAKSAVFGGPTGAQQREAQKLERERLEKQRQREAQDLMNQLTEEQREEINEAVQSLNH